ncbi:MAG: peptidoglycan-binding domain-containing protein [Terriglobia bacterium]
MLRTSKPVWTRIALMIVAAATLGLAPLVCAATPGAGTSTVSRRQNVKQVQESLRDKGYYSGKVDGLLGPQTRKAIRQYQKAENLRVTGRLDAKTAGKLGVNQESVGASFENAGRQVGEGSEAAGHQMKKGKPVAAGKEFGKGMGRFGKDVGKGVKKAVNPKSAPGGPPNQ